MPDFDPLAAVGLVFTESSEGAGVFTGSCFLFRHDDVVLTARHCLGDDLTVVFPRLNVEFKPREVKTHPSADIAIVFLDSSRPIDRTDYPALAFWDGVPSHGLGEEFFAYGYPSEGPSFQAVQNAPTPRLFVGHYQRFYNYVSPSGFAYMAGELSMPAPGGLSGGPIFRPQASRMVTGLVTANQDSYAVSDSIDLVEDNGTRYRQESRRILSYGVALMLDGVAAWLNDEIPARGQLGWILQPQQPGS